MDYWKGELAVEKWKDVRGLKGCYQVSNRGRVKSLPRLVYNGKGWWKLKERILKPGRVGKGYLQVHLSKKGETKDVLVSRLVAIAFIPNPHNLPEVNHKNGDKENCRASNLEWTTHVGNMKHAVKTGLMPDRRGIGSSGAKLSIKEVLAIRRDVENGDSPYDVASRNGVSYMAIYRIIKRKTWTNV